jgi:hypothetical protein
LVRGKPEPPTRGTACDVRRAYTGIGTFECASDLIEAGRDTGIPTRDSGNQELGVQLREERGLAAAARTEKSQMLATQKPLLQLDGELRGM